MTNQPPNNPQYGNGQQPPTYSPNGPTYQQNPQGQHYGQPPYGQPYGNQKSNTGIIIAIVAVVAALAIAAAVWFFMRGDDEEPAADPTTITTTDPAADPAPVGPTDPAEDPTDEDPAGGNVEDPDYEAFRAGIEKITEDAGFSREDFKNNGLTDEQIDFYFDCVSENTFEDLSDENRTMIQNGQDSQFMQPDDLEVLNAAVEKCSSDLQSQM